MRYRAEQPEYRALRSEYQRIVDAVDLSPRGIQAYRIAMRTHERSWEIDENDITPKQMKAVRDKLARLEEKGFVTIERTQEYGNVYRPVGSVYDKANWTLADAREQWAESIERGGGLDTLQHQVAIAAYAMTQSVWRNTIVEDCHADPDGPHDGEMFAANVSTFRIFREFLEAGDRSRDAWDRLRRKLTDPFRTVAAKDLWDMIPGGVDEDGYFEMWDRHATSLLRYFAELTEPVDHDIEWFIAVNSCYGASGKSRWFGMPGWSRRVEVFVSKEWPGPWSPVDEEGSEFLKVREGVRELPIPADELRTGLLDAPDLMDPDVLAWCIEDGLDFVHVD